MSTQHPEHDGSSSLGSVENSLGEVRLCDCGGVHLAMGPLTLHFDFEDLDDLVDLVCAGRHMAERGPDAADAEAGAPVSADKDGQPPQPGVPSQGANTEGDASEKLKAAVLSSEDEAKKPEKKKRRVLRSKAQSLLH
jgi:hypothetical protein